MSWFARRGIPDHVMRNMFLCHLADHRNFYRIYTDGSKTEQGTALSIACENTSMAFRINTNASIFTAEPYAILNAIEFAISTQHTNINIISDSKSSILAIKNILTRNPIIIKIHNLLNLTTKKFLLCWVPSHVGIRRNERANQLAKKGPDSNSKSLQFKIQKTNSSIWWF